MSAALLGFEQFAGQWGPRAELAWDTLALRRRRGIPAWIVHVMDIRFLEEFTGTPAGGYRADPDGVYIEFQRRAGACFLDQYLATNPLSMGQAGFEPDAPRTATTGAARIALDGIVIDSPEAVVAHLEQVAWPRREAAIAAFDVRDRARIEGLVAAEVRLQQRLGLDLLKAPYGWEFGALPILDYGAYGYENYLMAVALYPEVLERDFALQAELAARVNRVGAQAIVDGGLPRIVRLDHDIADSRGTLIDVRTLERIWLPHLARAIRPLLDAGIRPIWHCDGNLMQMVPRLLDAGILGFQGFQYEDGMDYPAICRMRDRAGEPLLIIAGVSVTTTLVHGTPSDVAAELQRLVEDGPPVGLFLGASSSIVPGTPHRNIRALIEGLHYYREHGRPA